MDSTSGFPTLASVQTTELRGRSDELSVLSHALDAAASGRGRVALLEGEAGIGKTRLLNELAARADALGVTVRRGVAEELEQGRPFGSLVDALGAPDAISLVAGHAGGDNRFFVQDAFVDHVERLAADGPVLVAIDDAHWADRATLATLWALARRHADLGLLLVVAFRPTPRPDELARVIDGSTDLDSIHLRLGPIADDALAALAADVVGPNVDPARLAALRGARGNPFVAIELLRTLVPGDGDSAPSAGTEAGSPELPAALRESLLRRVTALTPPARSALSVAAVLGGSGRLDELATLLGVSVADAGLAVTEAARAGLLEPSGDLLAFRHDLIRQALYEDLPESVRVGWHREAAACLDGRSDPAVVARHLALGTSPGDAEGVVRLLRVAEELVVGEPDAAVELLDRAIELTNDPEVSAELGVARAEALLEAGRAEQAGMQARAVLAAGGPDAVVAKAHLAHAESSSHRGLPKEALNAFSAALDTGALDERATAVALGRRAENRLWTFALDAALVEAEEALVEGRRLGIRSVQVDALAARSGVREFRAESAASIADGEEAVALAGDDPESMRRTPHAYLGLALLAADRLEDALSVAEEGRRRSTALGQVLVLPNYQVLLVRIGWFAGRWDQAIAEADAAIGLAEDFGLRFGETANAGVRGLIAFHRGDLAAARACVAKAGAADRGGSDDASGSELIVLLQAQLQEADGDTAGAAVTLNQLFELERSMGMDAARVWPGPACVRLSLASGDEAAARVVADDLGAIAERARTPSARGAAALARGLVERDVSALDHAATQFAAAVRPLDELQAREATGAAQSAAGDHKGAVENLQHALEIAERLGAAYDARRITASLRELGVRASGRERRARALTGWDALTEAELEVARLVDEGLRNGEIAERLFVSRRTVESHVSRLYAKLGAENRVALAKAIQQHAEPGAA